MKVLAVDDDDTILELLTASLSIFGHEEVLTAPSAEAALDLLKSERDRVDCFLLDIQMPGVDGITLCERIRAMRRYSRTPIIMLTAMSQRVYIERAFAAGATDYLTKPFDFLDLAFRLRMAERLAFEIRTVSDNRGELARMRQKMSVMPKPSLVHPVEIEDVDGAIGYTAFENYIIQLSRSSQLMSSVFAVVISDVQKIHEITTGGEYLGVLSSVAKAIVSSMNEAGSLISYRGNGIFICVTHRSAKVTRDDIKTGVDQFLKISQERECRGRTLRVFAGQQTPVGAFTKFGALQSIHRAIALLERSSGINGASLEEVVNNQNAKADNSPMEPCDPAAFESLLQDTLGNEISLIERYSPAIGAVSGSVDDVVQARRVTHMT